MKPNKKNSCIYILSGRHNVLEECIERLYDFYNHKYDFPVYVYYFDDIYTGSKVAKKLEHKYKIRFISQPTKIPSHINHKDLYFNKNYNYVKRSFGPERLNYLHMNDFVTNTNNKTHLNKYRFHQRIDDDTFFNKKIENNLFDIMYSNNYPMATSKFWSHYHSNARDVGMNLFDFYKNYLKNNSLIPEHINLKKAINNNDETSFHTLNWSTGNFNLYDQNFLRDNHDWKYWISQVNDLGGIYKHRWGDIKLIGLFLYTFHKNPCLNLNLIKDETIIHKTKKTHTITSDKFIKFMLKKLYRKIRYGKLD